MTRHKPNPYFSRPKTPVPAGDPPPTPQSIDYGRAIPVFALVFVDVLGLTIILPLLHLYAAVYGASPLEIGLVAAAFPLAQLIGVPVMGALSDRFGRKPLLIVSQISTCISFIMLGAANTLLLVALSRVFDGLFGANIATAQAALSDITTDENRAQGLGLIGAAFGLGFVFGPAIAFVTLELDGSLSLPAYIAAAYSFLSILLTVFVFKETLPPEKRRQSGGLRLNPLIALGMLRRPFIGVVLLLLFAQQVVFYGFEALLGLFTLSRLGLLGQGNAMIFLYVGMILIVVQVRYIGRWSRRYGERRLVVVALGLLALGLLMFALTPDQAHPLYVREIVERQLLTELPSGTEAIIGDIRVDLPLNESRGVGGVLWLLVAVIPVAIGSALIRPALNSLLTKAVSPAEYGRVLGVSASFVSAANAVAPVAGGLLFQQYGTSIPYLVGGAIMSALFLVALVVMRQPIPATPQEQTA